MKKYSFPFHFCPLSTLTVLLSIFFVFPLHFLIRIEHCLVCNKNKIRVNRVYSQTVEINWISHLFPFSTAKRWPCGHIYFTCSSFKFRLSHFHTVENEMQMGYRARPLSTQETSQVPTKPLPCHESHAGRSSERKKKKFKRQCAPHPHGLRWRAAVPQSSQNLIAEHKEWNWFRPMYWFPIDNSQIYDNEFESSSYLALNESFSVRSALITDTGSVSLACFWTLGCVTRMNGLMRFSSLINDGTVGSCFSRFCLAQASRLIMSWFWGSTCRPNAKFCREYSWPQ